MPSTLILGYGAGNFGFALLGLVVAVNLQYFYTDFVGLSAGLVAWSLLFARQFDSVTDPVMGYLSGRTKTRFGRRRPYFVGAAIPLAIAFYFLFTPPVVDDPASEPGYLLFYMLSLYILTYFIWTVGAIPYYSLGGGIIRCLQRACKGDCGTPMLRAGWIVGGNHIARVPDLCLWAPGALPS